MSATIKKKEIVLEVDDQKYETFLKFIKTLEYVQVINEQQQAMKELERSLKQVKIMQNDESKKQTAKEFLDEL